MSAHYQNQNERIKQSYLTIYHFCFSSFIFIAAHSENDLQDDGNFINVLNCFRRLYQVNKVLLFPTIYSKYCISVSPVFTFIGSFLEFDGHLKIHDKNPASTSFRSVVATLVFHHPVALNIQHMQKWLFSQLLLSCFHTLNWVSAGFWSRRQTWPTSGKKILRISCVYSKLGNIMSLWNNFALKYIFLKTHNTIIISTNRSKYNDVQSRAGNAFSITSSLNTRREQW